MKKEFPLHSLQACSTISVKGLIWWHLFSFSSFSFPLSLRGCRARSKLAESKLTASDLAASVWMPLQSFSVERKCFEKCFWKCLKFQKEFQKNTSRFVAESLDRVLRSPVLAYAKVSVEIFWLLKCIKKLPCNEYFGNISADIL